MLKAEWADLFRHHHGALVLLAHVRTSVDSFSVLTVESFATRMFPWASTWNSTDMLPPPKLARRRRSSSSAVVALRQAAVGSVTFLP